MKKEILFGQIEQAGFTVSEYSISEEKEVEEINVDMFSGIEKRCNELIEQYPGRKDLFINYMKSQEEEGNINANLIKCGVFVLKAKLCLI